MYNKKQTDSMKLELTSKKVEDLWNIDLVNDFMNKKELSSVVFVNSVCGCAANSARPAFINSLTHKHKPKQIGTVFAGQDIEAVKRVREFIIGYPPSSPSIAFFRQGELVYFLERSDIQGVSASDLSKIICSIYDKFFQKEIREDINILEPNNLIEINVEEVNSDLKTNIITLLDCREESEREFAMINPSIFLTQETKENIITKWDHQRKIAIYCHTGTRSKHAVNFFKRYGFENIYSVKGGIDAWSKIIDPSIPTY